MSRDTTAPNLGVVASVRGSVVDIRFDAHLPPIDSLLHAGSDGRIVIEVLAQRDARHVRGITLTPTQGLARGMAVVDARSGAAMTLAHPARLLSPALNAKSTYF